MKSREHEKLKVVLDTSVLVAGLLSKRGASAEVVSLVLTGKVHSFHTKAVMAELGEVLLRPKFWLDEQISEHYVRLLMDASFQVEPLEAFAVTRCRDPKDDQFLSLASQTEADYIVSLDKDLLDLKKHAASDIAEPSSFLKAYRARR